VALVADVDDLQDDNDAMTLLTLHAAKGLEYDVVFMVGMEEGLCPHSRSQDSPDDMEEERRLCYVGMTRARRRLYLLFTFRRTVFGNAEVRLPSPFLADIPAELMEGGGRRAMARPVTPATPQPRDRRELFDRRRERVERIRLDEPDRLRPRSERPGPPRSIRPGPAPLAGDDRVTTTRARPAPAGAIAQFRAGERVLHPIFGSGVVVSSRFVGDDEEVTVAFVDKGIKRLMMQYAKLEKVG
jgi:DNA helicase-2/ATP-dependent DNA helicase PcrA